MKKLTLFKLVLAAGLAFCLYDQMAPPATAATCPSFCFHLTCGGGIRAHCNAKGQCVCP
ncbi:MAG TPA: hypothetical protein VKZ53_17645 [Candidatus Angelobacter sp.]|nr:hypothetical protein [Candidatus Angelobacter sp.]